MSLLVFSYILAAFLFVFSYFLDSRSERSQGALSGIAMTSAIVQLFAGLATHLLVSGNNGISTILFKACLMTLSFLCLSLLRFAFAIPDHPKQTAINVFAWILEAAAVYIVLTGITSMGWNAKGGFLVHTRFLFGLADGLVLYAGVFLGLVPALALLVLLVRAVFIRSRIYRMRLIFVALSVLAGFAISGFLYYFSLRSIWIFPLIPFGFVVMLILVYFSVSISILFDRRQMAAYVVHFTVLTLVFSFIAALVSTLILDNTQIRLQTASVILVVLTVLLLALRDRAALYLSKFIRVGTDYESELVRELEAIDYTSGGPAVIQTTVELLERHVECSAVDILVADGKGRLGSVFSTRNAKFEVSPENKAIDFLTNRNVSLVLKTQAVTNHQYAEIKGDLLALYAMADSEALMLLREGHRGVGIILLGPKKRSGDYTEYDYAVMSRLYSNFFLVMYYLKNIANEAVVLTVDREIEFSGQIISSIQDNIDRIDHEKVDVDFITKSARKLGGDFIDFIKLADDKYLYVMGDVSGKGLNASMSMVILKSVLRTFLSETSDFKKLVMKVNLFIKNNLPKGTFFAGVFGILDFSTNTMHYINCGVPAMFLYTASYNNAVEIQGDGKVLGFVRDIGKYLKIKKIVLGPQDILLMTTDGLVDSTNLRGERFGKDRVQRLMMDNRSYPAGRMAQFLCDSLSGFVSRELEDDITVLVFKYLKK